MTATGVGATTNKGESTGNIVIDFTSVRSAGRYLWVWIGTKPATATTTTPAGWTRLGEQASATGVSAGNDVGDTLIEYFYKVSDGTEGSTTFTNGSNSVSLYAWGGMDPGAGGTLQTPVFHGAADNTAGSTTFSALIPSATWQTDDVAQVARLVPTDTGNSSGASAGPPNSSAVTWPTSTFGTFPQHEFNAGTSSGQDLAMDTRVYRLAGAGFTGTVSLGGTIGGTTNAYGPAVMVQWREVAGTTPVEITRATTWNVTGQPTITRATTWDTTKAVEATRATTWDVVTPVTVTRAATWNTKGQPTTTRATTWRVVKSVTLTRATSWDTAGAVSLTRATTWDANQNVTWVQRATTWNVAAPTAVVVTITRATTWDTRTPVATTRATAWDVTGAVAITRATSWDARLAVTVTRATTWDVVAAVTITRATTWRAVRAVTITRATTYDVTRAVLTTRATTWDATAVVTVVRATTWDARVVVLLPRTATWDTRATVPTVTRASSWNVAPPTAGTVNVTRSTTWGVRALLTVTRDGRWDTRLVITTTRSTTWAVVSTAPVEVVTRATTWAVLVLVGITRDTTWNNAGPPEPTIPDLDNASRAEVEPVMVARLETGSVFALAEAEDMRAELATRTWQNVNPYADEDQPVAARGYVLTHPPGVPLRTR